MASRSAEDCPLAVVPVPLAHGAPRALGFSEYDRSAITAFVSGDRDEIGKLVEDARQLADNLAGPGGDGARVRLLARTAAICLTQLRIVEGLLAQRVAARDFEAVAVLNKTVDGMTKRLLMAVKQLGVESALRTRPSVVVRHADHVEFTGGSR